MSEVAVAEEFDISELDTESVVPTYTSDDVRQATMRVVLAPNWYRFVVVAADKKFSKNGHFMLVLECAPLTGEEDGASTASPTIRHNVVLPFDNVDFPGHTKPNTAGICHSFLTALYPDEFPRGPRSKGSGVWEMPDGSLLTDYAAVQEEKQKVLDAVMQKLIEYWKEPKALEGESFYANVVINGRYRNLKAILSSPPEDETVVYDPAAMKDYPTE